MTDMIIRMAWQTLRLAFFLSLIIVVAEVGGGVLAHSLALLSDAGHALTDIFALGLAWFATAQMDGLYCQLEENKTIHDHDHEKASAHISRAETKKEQSGGL